MASYNRYSHHARRALTHASALVNRYRHPRVDTGHLLVGVMLTNGSIGYTVLTELGLRIETAAPHLESLTLPLETAPELVNNDAALDIALDLAADESMWLGHHYIGTEHLLLGITRTNLGNASDLLRMLEVPPEQVRRRVRRALNEGLTEFTLQFVRRNVRFSELSRRVLSAAEQHAVSLDHPTIGLGHLLIALMRERRGTTGQLLRTHGLILERVEADLKREVTRLLVSIEYTLDAALEIAEQHSNHYTGTDHLLLALLQDPVSAAILTYYGVRNEALYAAVVQQLNERR